MKQKFGKPWFRGSRKKCFLCIVVTFVIICVNIQWQIVEKWREKRMQEEKRRVMEEMLRHQIRARDDVIHEIEVYHNSTLNKTKGQYPSLIGIGVKKCGTDGLINFLGQHPQVVLPTKIDTEAFFFNRKFAKGMQFYKDMFPRINDREITAEKTPQYFDDLPQNLPQIIHKSLPRAKLFLVVCDPAKRSFSDYVQERVRYKLYNATLLKNFPTFDKYVSTYLKKIQTAFQEFERQKMSDGGIRTQLSNYYTKDTASILISTGLYYYHIQRWLKFYNESNLIIVDGEDFLKNPGKIVEQVQSFLGLPKLVWKEDFVRHPRTGFYCYRKFSENDLKQNRNVSESEFIESLRCLGKSKGRTRMGLQKPSNHTMEQLRSFYKPYNEKFFNLIGKKFDWG